MKPPTTPMPLPPNAIATPPRVLLLTADFPPFLTGVGDYTDRLSRHLHAQGVDVAVLTTAGPGDAVTRPYEVRRAVKDWSLHQRRTILEHARGFNLVHIQYPGVHYGRSPLINLLPRLLHQPCVGTFHEFRTMRWRWRLRTLPMLGGLDAIVHVDPDDGPLLRRWSVPGRPLFAAPIASNVEPVACDAAQRDRWRRELGLDHDEIAVVFFGILYPHKGIAEMLEAVASLRTKGVPVRSVVVGDFDREADYRPALEARLRASEVIWVRGASLERVSRVLHAGDVAMLPYHSGAGVNRSSLLAALEHGLPTITTDGPATPTDLGERFSVLLVPPRDSAALAASLTRLLDDRMLHEQMRTSAMADAAANAWPEVARRHLAIYRQLLNQAAAMPSLLPAASHFTIGGCIEGGAA